ncbi:hypothetical protein PISL3812_08825 [Talaromyces islandicus]|uniref:Uncharacterized protein n=1 Tax=Talaromyces islandicus TaxID=28573 RepID=A0A0U1M831_TALIS|nr:hypothetical protein PISL3812_08825 [Talaromyces islandicus]
MSFNGWKLVHDGTWRKELGGLEKVYRFQSTASRVTGREHWGLYSSCKLTWSDSLSRGITVALRDAWKALRVEFPALGLVIDGYEAVYRPENKSGNEKYDTSRSLEQWAQKTFSVEQNRTVEEIIAQYPLNDLPTLFWFPQTSELMILISHWRTDGLGSVMLLNRLLELFVERPDVSLGQCDPVYTELAKISPSLEDAAGTPLVPTPKILETAGRVSKLFREKAIKSVGIPFKGDRATSPGNTAIVAIVYTPESSKSLFDACKARQITVSAAIHTALAQTVFELTSAENITEYATIMSVNMRPYIEKPYNTSEHACRTYVTSITPTVRRGASFNESTTSLTQLFKNWYSKDFSQALREVYQGASRALLSPPPQLTGPPPNPPSGILHSNLGVVDRFLGTEFGDGALQISKFRFGVSMMTRQMLLYPWSFRGELNLSINYNDAFYDASSPQQVLEGIQRKLERELGVKLEPCSS